MNSYDIIANAVKAYWNESYSQDVVVFFYQKHPTQKKWDWCEELVESHGCSDYENVSFCCDFCEGQTEVKDITIVPLVDVTHYYAIHNIKEAEP